MWYIASFIAFIVLASGKQADPVVTIKQGNVVGNYVVDGKYFEFHGIPYADSTSGSHRFKAPSPAPNFQETFVANRRDVKCVRALGVGYEGTEDCLVVNVFTPSLENDRNLPVMVWVKGKEFDKVYEHELSFQNFMAEDVVVVSLNYRESILGFLCLGTEIAPGNAGLKDITAGLQWVKDNIAQFGGNPEDVTLFGHGSGGAAVDLVTLSPMTKGLVHKAIAQSGNAFAPWAVTRDNLEYAIIVAEALGHTVENIETLSEVFTRTSVAALMAVINELDLTDNSLAFAPCIEKEDLEGGDPFLVKSPYKIITEEDYMQIPFMTGFVDHEGTIRSEELIESDWLEKMETSFSNFIQTDLTFKSSEEKTQVIDEIKNFYFESESGMDIESYLNYHGDTMILVSTIREARLRALTSSTPVYLYQFSYKGTLGQSFVGPLTDFIDSAAHSEELAYLFYDKLEEQVAAEMDLTIGDVLVERWTNFAKSGVPESRISNILWEPFTMEEKKYLRILDIDEISSNAETTLEIPLTNPHAETMTLWDEIYDEHFLDATGRWILSERNEEDEDDDNENNGEDGDGDDNEDNDDDGDGDENEDNGEDIDGNNNDNNENEADEDDDDENDSASTAVGYTFSIITIFVILNKFHLSQVVRWRHGERRGARGARGRAGAAQNNPHVPLDVCPRAGKMAVYAHVRCA
ncbi:alpha-esterase 3 [Aphomia sociella]